jgi:hypothetical protein
MRGSWVSVEQAIPAPAAFKERSSTFQGLWHRICGSLLFPSPAFRGRAHDPLLTGGTARNRGRNLDDRHLR